MGKRFPISHDIAEVVETGGAEAEEAEVDVTEHAAESKRASRALEAYAPVIDGGYVIGAFGIYADAARIETSIASKKRLIWLATFIVFALLWALLGMLVRG